ncbi:hybrid sensor histidine kinase/response regulator [Terriglobus aquaticus]|uniref:histidine kinase n=1 Tax=Terriglobus aquaticus TaxID=940139 RepID=A0ABW9KJG7_9BACT|nr:hybrid sensor histidine kinase/response regulator [Terriglobus aquaticus]
MPTEAVDARPLRILLVEDNADDAALLERHLRRSGFRPDLSRVETAEEFQRGLAQLPAPELVLADYNLPSFSGPEALHLLRSSGQDIPFIMMSGAMSEETAVASMRAGAQDYVIKQNLARLVPAVERELREAATRSSRRAVEAALHVSELRFHRLVDAMPIGLLLADGPGRITYANASAAVLLGHTNGALLDTDTRLDHYGIDAAEAIQEPREISLERADGTSAELLVAATYLNPDKSVDDRELAIFLVDLSKQKHSEELLRRTEKLAVAGRLAASIAHEINNPLAAVTNCLFLVANTELTPDGRNFLEIAQKELDRVAQITVQTLRFHRQSSRPVQSDLRDLAETVLALFELRLRRQEITVHRDFGGVRPLLCFEGEIRQVIVNLLGNAIDASGGGGEITLRTRQLRTSARPEQGIAFTIADRGTGIPAEALCRLFEPFFSTKGITGTGLGLWVSQEIIARHGGNIRVRSRVRTGDSAGCTVFRVFLPLDGIPTPAASAEQELPG